MSTPAQRKLLSRLSDFSGWSRLALKPDWASWLVIACFVWQFVYVPLHLMVECHYPHFELSKSVQTVMDQHCQDTHGDHHVPHCVSDHTLPVAVQVVSLSPLAPCVVADTTTLLNPADYLCVDRMHERCSPPGRPPPGPSLPRAPPLA